MFPFESLPSILTSVGALLTAVGGIVMAYAAVVRARKEGRETGKTDADADCRERLRLARVESERLAEELHVMRMRELGGHIDA